MTQNQNPTAEQIRDKLRAEHAALPHQVFMIWSQGTEFEPFLCQTEKDAINSFARLKARGFRPIIFGNLKHLEAAALLVVPDMIKDKLCQP